MKRLLAVFALIALSTAIVVLTAVQGQDSNANKFRRARADKKIHDQYIVVLKDNVSDVDLEAARLAQNYFGDRSEGHTYRRALKGFSVRMSEKQAEKLAADPRVAFVEEDSEVDSLGDPNRRNLGTRSH